MIAFACPESTDLEPAWHTGFAAMLPRIQESLRFAFRKMRPDERAEATAECVASIAVAYRRMFDQGRADLAFATPLTNFAIRQYYAGRRVGSPLNVDDISSVHCQRKRGFFVKSLDQRNPAGDWKEIVVEDHRNGPAEVAASRIDLADWFGELPRLKRGIAETLASGETTSATARQFDVTPGRISQIRRELENDWAAFQGEPLVCA